MRLPESGDVGCTEGGLGGGLLSGFESGDVVDCLPGRQRDGSTCRKNKRPDPEKEWMTDQSNITPTHTITPTTTAATPTTPTPTPTPICSFL